MKNRITKEIRELKILLRSVPSLFFAFFAVSVILMNLLANKSIDLPFEWLALDCGIIISWVSFLCMDIATRHFGPKAAIMLSIAAVFINLLTCLVFFAASRISGVWGESFVEGSESVIINALDNTIGGTWYVLLGSTIAFTASAVINNLLNYLIGRIYEKRTEGGKENFRIFAIRSYISTAAGQFSDNLIFALIVSHIFFGWTIVQCITCALTGMIFELLCEVIFSPLGYRISIKWKKENIGEDYLKAVAGSKA